MAPLVCRVINAFGQGIPNAHVIHKVGDSLYVAGSNLAVDEAMVRFIGWLVEKTTVPSKPTPVGYKVWVLALSGYFLR